ncbi:MAG: hypothetical protein BGO99_10775 [Nitrosospira sp. 56-18]|jgi:hypothetical protein|nr:hypothetical protein [Nitrosospira sp.]OJY09288.1 MAG: hypothetical protein BGO99_10775 [Nitrosospira sp. 56-18]
MCSSKPPKPDPQIGAAALQQADIAKQQLDLAKDQLAYNKQQSEWQDPLIQKIAQQQIDTADTNNQRSDEQWQLYKTLFQPVEAKMVNDAMNFDSPERQAQLAAQAGADVTKSYQGAQDQNQRNMERMGVNPNSGKFQAISNEAGLAQAADTAGAMNTARNNAITQGMALRQGAAQFGRNMPNTGLAADSTALNAGNSAVGNIAQGNNINNANAATAQNWFGGAMNGNNSAAGILNNQYQNQLNAWAQKQNSLSNMIGGIAGLAGSLGGAAILARKGGVIKNNTVYRLSSGYRPRFSDYGLRRKGYAEGGMIEGPGTATSDSIPATIEGQTPIRVSNGEAVLNAEAVQLVGEPFIHNINAAGLMMLSRKKPAQAVPGSVNSLAGLSNRRGQ